MVGGLYVSPGKPVALFSIANGPLKASAPPEHYESTKYYPWGDNNAYPQDLITAVNKNPVIGRALAFKKESHIAKGLQLYKEVIAEDGKTVEVQLVKDPEVEKFFQYSNIEMFINGIVDDHYLHGNYFPELIFDKAGKKIAMIARRDPAHCRWEVMDKRSLKINNLHFSYNFPDPKETPLTIPALDPIFPVADLNDKPVKKAKSFALRINYNTRGDVYYNKPEWHGLIDGWLSISNSIPIAVKSLLKNQMLLKWHVEIEYNYFSRAITGFAQMSKKDQDAAISAHLQQMNDFLTDTENTGKAFLSYFRLDSLDQKTPVPDIKIAALDNKLGDLKYITDFQRSANSEVLFGLGIDGTLFGQNSPGGSESGSGSNKREAMWINQQLLNLHRTLTIAPWWNVVREFNEWPSEYKLGFREIDTSQTIDKNPSKTTEQI